MFVRFAKLFTADATANQPPAPRAQLTVEPLEDRTVPSKVTVGNVAQLITAIAIANATPESDTITLAPGKTFTLKEVNNYTTQGANGLPVITAVGGSLTILGNGDIIERKEAKNIPAFRFFEVEVGASLTLKNLELRGGVAQAGFGPAAQGGGILNADDLTLKGVTIRDCKAIGFDGLDGLPTGYLGAMGQPGYDAAGGGVYSIGKLRMDDCTVTENAALGGDGGKTTTPAARRDWAAPGGDAFGGGVCVAGGTAEINTTTSTLNTAEAGKTGNGTSDWRALFYSPPGKGLGGGIYLAPGVYAGGLDAFTVDQTTSNTASTQGNNIYVG